MLADIRGFANKIIGALTITGALIVGGTATFDNIVVTNGCVGCGGGGGGSQTLQQTLNLGNSATTSMQFGGGTSTNIFSVLNPDDASPILRVASSTVLVTDGDSNFALPGLSAATVGSSAGGGSGILVLNGPSGGGGVIVQGANGVPTIEVFNSSLLLMNGVATTTIDQRSFHINRSATFPNAAFNINSDGSLYASGTSAFTGAMSVDNNIGSRSLGVSGLSSLASLNVGDISNAAWQMRCSGGQCYASSTQGDILFGTHSVSDSINFQTGGSTSFTVGNAFINAQPFTTFFNGVSSTNVTVSGGVSSTVINAGISTSTVQIGAQGVNGDAYVSSTTQNLDFSVPSVSKAFNFYAGNTQLVSLSNTALTFHKPATFFADVLSTNTVTIGVASSSELVSSVTSTLSRTVLMPNLPSSAAVLDFLCYDTASKQMFHSNAGCLASSARFKEHIESLNQKTMMEEVLKLRTISFDYKDTKNLGSLGTSHDEGFLAEEVAMIDPYLVVYERNPKIEDLAFEMKNYPDTIIHQGKDVLIPQSVRYDRISILEAGAIQNLDERITKLESNESLITQLINALLAFLKLK